MKFNYVLECKEDCTVKIPTTKKSFYRTYKWKQLAVAENKQDLEPYLIGHENTRRIVKRWIYKEKIKLL